MSSEEGGTKLRKNRPQQMSQAPQPQFDPQQVYTRQQGPPPQQMGQQMAQMGQMGQMPTPQQMAQMPPQMQQQIMQQASSSQMPRPYQGKKLLENSNAKSAMLVVLIFLLLNSKLVWKQIINLPMMGNVEPSMIALIFNSLLAGIIFYIIINFLMK
jgi:hypothetical protein